MSDDHSQGQSWKPSHNPWLIAVTVMSATFMEVLDTSVANVSLPHIAGSLAVTTEESTWILTSYLVANAIVLPMTGWLGNYFGRKRLLIACISMFTIASVLCGMASNLPFLILARVLQGAGGGAMVPISQAILLESFPPQKRGVAMAAFAMGVVVAPIIGPTLGGWITDNYSWRWIFYINLPVGIAAAMMCEAVVEDPPYITNARVVSIDLTGFVFLALWLGTLQVVLDKGEQEAWFESQRIRWMAVISVVSFLVFLVRELKAKHPLVDLRVLTNRNFSVGLLMITLVGAVLYGTTAALPIFLQTLLGYPALQSGLALSPRGIGALCTTILVGRIIGKVKNRHLIFFGFALLAISSFWLGRINLTITPGAVIWPSVVNGIAVSFIFVPLTTISLGHLRQDQMPNATGLFNLMRNLGGSFGIAGVTALLSRVAQMRHVSLVAHLSPYNPVFQQHYAGIATALHSQTGSESSMQALHLIYAQLLQQAQLFAFVFDFRLFGVLCIGCMPLVYLFKSVRGKKAPAGAH
jgi:DHA2 family multidrug resistance protein